MVVVVVAANPSEPQSDNMKIQVYPSQMLEQTHYSTKTTSMDSFFLGNPIAPQVVNKFPLFCGTPRFITMSTRACHLPMSLDKLFYSTQSHFYKMNFIIIIPYVPRLFRYFVPSGFLSKIPSALIFSTLNALLLSPSLLSSLE